MTGDDITLMLRDNPWAEKFLSDFALFKVGGYVPWIEAPESTPRRRTEQAFRIFSLVCVQVEPFVIARNLARALGE